MPEIKKKLCCTRYLDTETTGLRGAELVELCLLNSVGKPLIDTLLRPTRATSWPEAERIHGISAKMVKDAPTLEEVIPDLIRHLTGHHLVVYNLGFDIAFFPEVVQLAPRKQSCAMLEFAQHIGDWNEYYGSYRWKTLAIAAAHVKHRWSGEAHRARADADACRSVWLYLRQAQRDARAAAVVEDAKEAEG